MITTGILALLLLISIAIITHLFGTIDVLEKDLSNRTEAAHRYSKESLDRFEEIFELRQQIVSLEKQLEICGTEDQETSIEK